MSIRARRIAQTHKILGLVIGLQLFFWTASGLFFTLFPIEQIRGEHLRAETPAIDPAGLGNITPPDVEYPFEKAELRQVLDRPVWEVSGNGRTRLYEASTGEKIAPLEEADVRRVAEEGWAGRGYATTVERIDNPPREAFSTRPLWRVEFEGLDRAVFWVDAETARIVAVRTTKWRIFDVFWRFHIMDITGDDRFDSWWLKIAAFLGLSTVLFGIALLVHRAMRGRLVK
ncbi:hypothetical protein [Henriciella sp.]|uniref:hypothetical protein n=1 Tax=Henriciella sp. TaxID=1968823 RepID=UPI002620CCFB|nr:hypothetical protein [Henriciella sp.]